MSDKDLPFILLRISLITLAFFWFCFLCVDSTTRYIVTDHKVASKTLFPADCIDGDGNTRTHLENWTSTAGACDSRVCYEGSLETDKWQINYDCLGEIDYLDKVNCEYVSNTSLPFPYCCPSLVCDTEPTATTTLAPCADRSPTLSCIFWKEQTNCTDSTNQLAQDMYNFTIENCQLTCGYCTP